jgi:putative membrane protein
MHASLFILSLWFWLAIFARRGSTRWQALLVLLVTGKLFCMLGVLLVFSPRLLYAGISGGGYAHLHAQPALADQQLAGLLMIAACPLTYVLAAIIIAARWLGDISAKNRLLGFPQAARVT